METDQIQSLLYKKSDKITETDVENATGQLWSLVDRKQARKHTAKVGIGISHIHYRGEKLHINMEGKQAIDRLNSGLAEVWLPVGELLHAIARTLKESLKPEDRAAYVKQFVTDVENLKGQVEELGDRLSDVENQ